ncbi:MAG TPA: nickel pincer cofactor biosynthesis protein LarB, partial [Acidimicrobiaceae bacterium]|nr:nickel pincer cofactor biosynthesis protein LarB [Acidimicrobiaceae bacterium]
MDESRLREMLAAVADGSMPPDDALTALRRLPFVDLAHSRIDHHRRLRTGQAEAVYGPNKTPTQCVEIVGELLAGGDGPVVLTRAGAAQTDAVLAAHPGGAVHAGGRVVVWRAAPGRAARVVVAAAGTSDESVADEAAAVLGAHGVAPRRLADIGLAGLHRFLAEIDSLAGADVVVVVAGMEGALATAVGGVTAAPVVAVPTSTGYGAALDGVTALLAMLASCAAGVTVVGIDNGFGAAMAALRVLDLADRGLAAG